MQLQQLFIWLSISVLGCTSIVHGEQSPQRREQIQKWRKVYVTEAKSHDITVGGFLNRRKLELHSDPLLAYANPIGGKDTHGQFFVWMESGRPAVVATIWSKLTEAGGELRSINHSMHTLSSEPIRDILHGDVFWTPNGKQVISQIVEGAPKPAKSERVRLTQMRRLAREFKAVEMKRRKQTGDSVPHALRLQGEPMLRFKSPKKGIQDGSLFAYFIDWDPDLVLLLESKETEDGFRWHFSTVPFTPSKITVSRKGKEWEHDASWKAKPTEAYKSVHGVAFRPDIVQ